MKPIPLVYWPNPIQEWFHARLLRMIQRPRRIIWPEDAEL